MARVLAWRRTGNPTKRKFACPRKKTIDGTGPSARRSCVRWLAGVSWPGARLWRPTAWRPADSPYILKKRCIAPLLEYDWGMSSVQEFVDSQLARGRGFFTKPTALAELGVSPEALKSAIARLSRKGDLVSPRRGFYLILRPEDKVLGAPDAARWIDPLMKFLEVDYRISLLRAAAFHGASHQAAMVFQVLAPRQLPDIEIGRQRVEFLYQSPKAFSKANRFEWLSQLKTDAGFAKVAGVDLTLLDICRYFHQAGGINAAAQAIHDLGKKADARILTKAAGVYENSAVRRLGYLLEHFGHVRQANALRPIAEQAKSFKPLDPSVKPIVPELAATEERNAEWKLTINVPVEIDS
jgi:predicted transcriptional regulator of viral defense system